MFVHNREWADQMERDRPGFFTGLMALLMSLIISASLILVKEGYTDLFFDHLLNSWKLAFVFAWPSAYICAYVIQTHVLSRIDFY